jgi:hypothetical protein
VKHLKAAYRRRCLCPWQQGAFPVNKVPEAIVDDSVKIARTLEVSVEYLIDGVNSTVPREIDAFYMRYKKFSVLLKYPRVIHPAQSMFRTQA